MSSRHGVAAGPAQLAWARSVRDAVSLLDETTRQVLTLVYFDGMSLRGAAARLRMSERRLRCHLSRGMQQLSDVLVSQSQE